MKLLSTIISMPGSNCPSAAFSANVFLNACLANNGSLIVSSSDGLVMRNHGHPYDLLVLLSSAEDASNARRSVSKCRSDPCCTGHSGAWPGSVCTVVEGRQTQPQPMAEPKDGWENSGQDHHRSAHVGP